MIQHDVRWEKRRHTYTITDLFLKNPSIHYIIDSTLQNYFETLVSTPDMLPHGAEKTCGFRFTNKKTADFFFQLSCQTRLLRLPENCEPKISQKYLAGRGNVIIPRRVSSKTHQDSCSSSIKGAMCIYIYIYLYLYKYI